VRNISHFRVNSHNCAYALYVNGIQVRLMFLLSRLREHSVICKSLVPIRRENFLGSTSLAPSSLRNFAHLRGAIVVRIAQRQRLFFVFFVSFIRFILWLISLVRPRSTGPNRAQGNLEARAEKWVHPLPLVMCARFRPTP
jgi:hypothetical protein